jgi:enoyl-CoA hydratase
MSTLPLLVDRPLPGCAVLTLNRPHALNALSADLRSTLVEALDTLSDDDTVRVLVVTGAGRAFCAGLDLKEIGSLGVPQVGQADDPVAALERFPLPVVAAVNGLAVTGGLELALACDVVIASSDARFADTHARIGVIPGWGLSQKLGRLIGTSRAKEMAFTGNFVDARTAEKWGMVNRIVAPERLMDTCLAMAADIASAAPRMLRAYKALIDDGQALALGEARALERRRSNEWALELRPEDLAARRTGLLQRGRSQADR